MKTMIAFLIFLMVPVAVYAQPFDFAQGGERFSSNPMIIETPNGERRVRYERCDELQNCRIVERTISYPICDEHHNCRTVDAFETGKAKLWDEEELARNGTFVFSAPLWQ